jgi:hypothetical protein
LGRGGIATSEGEIQDQFGVALDCHEAVGVADVLIVSFKRNLCASFFWTYPQISSHSTSLQATFTISPTFALR